MRIDTTTLVALQLQLLQHEEMTDHRALKYIQTQQEWDFLRPVIAKLYVDEGWELARVMEEIERAYHLRATKRMYNTRIKAWGLRKHQRRGEVEAILRIKAERARAGKETTFVLGGREVSMQDIDRYKRKHQILVSDLLETGPTRTEIPDLEWYTPPGSPSSGSSPLVLTPQSSSASSSYGSVPQSIALPAALGDYDSYFRGISTGFSVMITTGLWALSSSLEMAWSPTPVRALSQPVISNSYHQDECYRYLTNGVTHIRKGDKVTGYKEWNAAFSLISDVVRSAHYNTVGKLLECIYYLDRRGHRPVARMFQSFVCEMAQAVLGPDHPYYHIFCGLANLPLDEIGELQTKTQECLVNQLEGSLGPQAFVSFEHKMVLAQRKLESQPVRNIDELMPTEEQCIITYGPTSSKTLLALNLRYCVLRSRGLLREAQDVAWSIIQKAMLIEDKSLRLWHLTSAWVSLARIQSDLKDFRSMRASLISAWEAENELRNDHGIVKLGEGELNWIFEKVGLQPIFREMDPIDIPQDDSFESA
ncbi:uncharacterized protein PV09_07260 [Verruconis gallopava]|uniref:Clr5 domain-containing protein n=1 Tax=Verruconis gallopava TaxID=253628 RepID=A0A0D2A345_9PEZI|nr:uncharacterized protein PV09_07260 [Verruconis gallopava]KIW01213.1 hypothetical protein PV09_07260 [Verruconis gallopava]